jgi:nicotinate-nucleotide adenylyltransferase
MRIGLFGGSFDPPHAGHVAASRLALSRLRLDRLWWLVTPGNPLKPHAPADLDARLAAASAAAGDPRIAITGAEATFGTRYTADTLAAIVSRHPAADFVWVMGADNLAGFHRWRNWRGIAELLPMAVVDRPGSTLTALASPAARALGRHRVREAAAKALPGSAPPAWTFLHGPRIPLSSSDLRRAGDDLKPSPSRPYV